MKKSQKILSIILTVLTLVSVFSCAMPVWAAEVTAYTEQVENSTEITTDEANTENETVTTSDEKEAEILCEIEDLRTENTKYFRQSDGTYLAAQYATPVHYEKDGKWEEIDNTLTEITTECKEETSIFSLFKETDTAFVTSKSKNPAKFPDEFDEDGDKKINISVKGHKISFSPKGEQMGLKNSDGNISEITDLQATQIIKGSQGSVNSQKKYIIC